MDKLRACWLWLVFGMRVGRAHVKCALDAQMHKCTQTQAQRPRLRWSGWLVGNLGCE